MSPFGLRLRIGDNGRPFPIRYEPMWFRNLHLFRFIKPFALSAEELAAQLAQHAFRPPGSLELSTSGWVPPMGRHGEDLVHAGGGRIMLCLRKEERVLPASVVREQVENKVAELEVKRGRPVGRKERATLREEIIATLIPRALPRSSHTFGYLDPKAGWLVVDAASARRAEEFASLLRRVVGSLPVVPPLVKESPAVVMTEWLAKGTVPHDVEILDEAEFRDPDGEGVVRCRKQELGGSEVAALLKAGKRAVRLAAHWNQRLTCVLAEDLTVKRLKFTDLVLDQLDEYRTDDYAARFDADFTLMTLELEPFLARLLELFGGEDADSYSI